MDPCAELGAAFTSEVKQAWAAAHGLLAGVMQGRKRSRHGPPRECRAPDDPVVLGRAVAAPSSPAGTQHQRGRFRRVAQPERAVAQRDMDA